VKVTAKSLLFTGVVRPLMTVSQEDTQPFSPLPAWVVRLSECGFSHTVELHLDGSRLVIEPV
jgi:hypothetical protein